MPTIQVIEDDAIFVPNVGGQQAFMDDYKHRYCALAGGWYAGKTWAGARKMANIHVFNAFDASNEATFCKSLAVAQDYQLARTQNIPEIEAAFSEMGLNVEFVADPKKFWFEVPDLGTKSNPSLVYVRSAEAPEKINAFTVGQAWGDEVARWMTSVDNPRRDPRLQTMGRIRDPKATVQQFNMTFTHEGDDTAVYRDFEEKPKPNHMLYRAGSFENPHAVQFADGLKGQLTAELADQYLEGKAVSFRGGKVYGSFIYADNVDERLILDPVLPLHLAIDFNISPGMHGIVGQYFPDHDLATAVYELHARGMTIERMLPAFQSLIAKNGGWNYPELLVYGDVSGNARWNATGESSWMYIRNWFRVNMPTLNVRYKVGSTNPLVADRVNAVNCALHNISGKVRYRIHPRCERLIDDYKMLKWEGNEVAKDDRKLSHASDADGYRIHWIMPVRAVRPSTDAKVGTV